MQSARAGEIAGDELISLSKDYLDAEYGCPNDSEFSFQLLDAAVPSPIPISTDPQLIFEMSRRLGALGNAVDPDRALDIREKTWLLRATTVGGGYLSHPRNYMSQYDWQPGVEHADMLLSEHANFAVAVELFGTNRSRDDALLRVVSDPTGPMFDRQIFAQLATTHFDQAAFSEKQVPRSWMFKAASQALDPALGDPDPELSSDLLLHAQLTPFHHRYGLERIEVQAGLLWQSIAERFSNSENGALQARGQMMLSTGDPMVMERVVPADLPQDSLLVSEWPEDFYQPDWSRFTSLAYRFYTPRALRFGHAGPIETALHYGADGQFQGYTITRSSGSNLLDEATLRSLVRDLRPRPPENLPPHLVQGREVLISLPVFVYHITHGLDLPAGELKDGRLIVRGAIPAASEPTC